MPLQGFAISPRPINPYSQTALVLPQATCQESQPSKLASYTPNPHYAAQQQCNRSQCHPMCPMRPRHPRTREIIPAPPHAQAKGRRPPRHGAAASNLPFRNTCPLHGSRDCPSSKRPWRPTRRSGAFSFHHMGQNQARRFLCVNPAGPQT